MSFSWERFALRGSVEGGNPDGWGVAYMEGTDARVLREPHPAANSDLVAFLGHHGPDATTVISHVRRATAGAKGLENTQPFARVLGGRTHVFAHNGHVGELPVPSEPWLRPVGSTDSELLFGVLLRRLEPLWRGTSAPSLDARSEVVARFAEEMRALGALNFLYADGLTLFAHGHRRTIEGDGISDEPGLYLLLQPRGEPCDDVTPCRGLGCEGERTDRAFVATVPLDDQTWKPLGAGELLRLQDGVAV